MVQGRIQKVSYKSKKNIRLPKKEWKIVKNTHDPIIDSNTFQKANEMINLRKQTRIKTHDYLLKGCIYCHECRSKMYCSSRHLASGIKYYFRCSTNTKSLEKSSCTPHSIRMDYAENIILEALTNIIKKYYDRNLLETVAEEFFNRNVDLNDFANLLDSYNKKIHEITSEIDKLYSDKISRHN